MKCPQVTISYADLPLDGPCLRGDVIRRRTLIQQQHGFICACENCAAAAVREAVPTTDVAATDEAGPTTDVAAATDATEMAPTADVDFGCG